MNIRQFPDAELPNPSTATIPNTGVTFNQATSQLPSDKNNFGPRFGFAVSCDGRWQNLPSWWLWTVLRAHHQLDDL